MKFVFLLVNFTLLLVIEMPYMNELYMIPLMNPALPDSGHPIIL
ncbi:hypothetical protein ACFQ9Y_06530 [Peribacillus simplex]